MTLPAPNYRGCLVGPHPHCLSSTFYSWAFRASVLAAKYTQESLLLDFWHVSPWLPSITRQEGEAEFSTRLWSPPRLSRPAALPYARGPHCIPMTSTGCLVTLVTHQQLSSPLRHWGCCGFPTGPGRGPRGLLPRTGSALSRFQGPSLAVPWIPPRCPHPLDKWGKWPLGKAGSVHLQIWCQRMSAQLQWTRKSVCGRGRKVLVDPFPQKKKNYTYSTWMQMV